MESTAMTPPAAEQGGRKELRFDTGVVTYNLNGVFTLAFNPTDPGFCEKLFSVFSALDQRQEDYRREVEKADRREVFNIARRRDAEMRELLDGTLGDGVCRAAFGGMNVYALADGLPVWANLLLAVLDEMDASMVTEQRKTNPRLEKYTSKYHR